MHSIPKLSNFLADEVQRQSKQIPRLDKDALVIHT